MRLPLPASDLVSLGRQHGAVEMRVFGSFARGTEAPDSDLDLLVRFAPGRTLLDLVELKHRIEDQSGRAVDIVTEAALHPSLRDRVLADAVRLDGP